MNPTKCFSVSTAFASVLVLASGASINESAAADLSRSTQSSKKINAINSNYAESVQVLEDLVVERDAKLSDVRYESDDSVSLTSSNQFVAFKAINSGPGAAVNFDLFYARRSVNMTADGYHTLEQMALALAYMDSGAGLELQVHTQDSTHRKLAERRVNELLALLRNRYRVKNPVEVSFTERNARLKKQKTGKMAPELLPLTLINLGNNVVVN